MNDKTSHRREALFRQFLERALSSLAHELKNHLASINETAGWLDDLMNLHRSGLSAWLGGLLGRRARQTGVPEPDKFFEITARIERQVQTLAGLAECLNRFAHQLGPGTTSFDPCASCEEVTTFLRGRGRERRVELTVDCQRGRRALGDPTCFYLATFYVCDFSLDRLPPGTVLTLKSHVTDGALTLALIPTAPLQDLDRTICREGCIELVEGLGATVDQPTDGTGPVVEIHFPNPVPPCLTISGIVF